MGVPPHDTVIVTLETFAESVAEDTDALFT